MSITIENDSIEEIFKSYHHNFVTTTTSEILQKVQKFIKCDFDYLPIRSETVGIQVSGSLYVEAQASSYEDNILTCRFRLVPFMHIRYNGSPNTHDGIDPLKIPLSHYVMFCKFNFTGDSDRKPIQLDIARIIVAIINAIEFETGKQLVTDDIDLMRDMPSRVVRVQYSICKSARNSYDYSQRTDTLLRVFMAIAMNATGDTIVKDCTGDELSLVKATLTINCRNCQKFFMKHLSRYLVERDRM